jgi:hypothetical protein
MDFVRRNISTLFVNQFILIALHGLYLRLGDQLDL